jgi:hypothetical protein
MDGGTLHAAEHPLMAVTVTGGGSWRLCVGTHTGTMMSRDSDSQPYPDEKTARAAWAEQERTIAAAGHKVWFATLFPPEGSGQEPVTLHAGVPYYG